MKQKPPMNPNDPMTHEQRKKLNAMCGDLEKQVMWNVSGIERKMHKDDWRYFFVAHVLGNATAPSIEGDRLIVFSRSSRDLRVGTAQACIDLIQHFGDSKGVMWTDPDFVSQMQHYQQEAA